MSCYVGADLLELKCEVSKECCGAVGGCIVAEADYVYQCAWIRLFGEGGNFCKAFCCELGRLALVVYHSYECIIRKENE